MKTISDIEDGGRVEENKREDIEKKLIEREREREEEETWREREGERGCQAE